MLIETSFYWRSGVGTHAEWSGHTDISHIRVQKQGSACKSRAKGYVTGFGQLLLGAVERPRAVEMPGMPSRNFQSILIGTPSMEDSEKKSKIFVHNFK